MFNVHHFKYKLGRVFVDGWAINENEGDCSDFALTVAYHESGKSVLKLLWNILTFRFIFWLSKSPDNDILPRHTVLYDRKKGYIDSSIRYWRASSYPHKKVIPLLFPWVYIRMAMGYVLKGK